ncbi:uncharacterized protein P174DRAFT_37754 [Aspergillus novofumigatus IBT 16806]|uniref:Uncharacterized protein n=1 Tax=Aspergillus novofumigatus (strain IBT 16806) TaxID=1392255 RepID=A0A2I1CN69_ASPN1|nr:uncharacterized protein P174DRAFT_37754 [Aspergillus novofumigatus IBT 16806]PKX99069.1 hypothetical protein P174DRAFT_37754 [Aspergillus novofumigatus IBT 16806]
MYSIAARLISLGGAQLFFEWGRTWLLIQKDGRVYKGDLRESMMVLYSGKFVINEIQAGWKKGYAISKGLLRFTRACFSLS